MSDQAPKPQKFRVRFLGREWEKWRFAGCDGWRVEEAERRFAAGEYDFLEVLYLDGSSVVHATERAAALRPDAEKPATP